MWPGLWPCDLEVMGVCWTCPYLPSILIWWWSEVVKAVKWLFQCLTLKGQYLTLRAKIQKSALCKFCGWSQRTFLCIYNADSHSWISRHSRELYYWYLEVGKGSHNHHGYVALCGYDRRSLRQSNDYFSVWPWKVNIWPWGQKFKIPLSVSFAYGPKEHPYMFITLTYQNCKRSSQK